MRAPRESRFRAFAAKLRGVLTRQHRDDGFADEIQEHVRLLADRFVAQGMSREEAARAARRQFGNTTLLQEDRRALQIFPAIEAWWYDLRYALRVLWKERGFAAVSMVTLGLGIGAATAIFSVIYNVLLAPFPEKGADRMVFARIQNVQQGQPGGRQGYTATEVLEFAANSHSFDGIIAASGQTVLHRHGEGTEQFRGALVSPGTFEFFGMPALHGRVMQPGDYVPGAPPVFVMRHQTWMTRFNGDLSLLDKTFVLSGTGRTLVGIMPPRFAWYGADLWIPEELRPEATSGFADAPPRWFMLGRLKPGLSTQEAGADLTIIARRLAKSYPRNYPAHFTVQVGTRLDAVVSRFATWKATLYTVLAAVGLLLLIACSNVAHLMLARATGREKEFALRAALGAGRMRLVRLVMVESLVLATAGGMLGILVASGGLTLLVAAMPPNLIPAQAVIELNPPVLAFTLCVAILTTLIFGLVPALQGARRDVSEPLRDSGKGVIGGFRGRWLRDALVVMEVALSLTLLIGAGLLMRSFVALRQVDLGLQAERVFQTSLILPATPYPTTEQVPRFFQPLLARVKALPGVLDAAASSTIPPFSGDQSKVEIAGKAVGEDLLTLVQRVSVGYFRVLRIEFTRGRPFSEAEIDRARHVAVVNETFVRRYLPGEDPIGRRLRLAGPGTAAGPGHDAWFDIVGVVADVFNSGGLQLPTNPEVWMPYTIAGSAPDALIVHTSQEPGTIANAVRQEVWRTDSGVALSGPGPLNDLISEQLYTAPRFGFAVMTSFGAVGLILVTVGVYSVLAYATTQKTHEIGVRMALGAERSAVLGMVVRAGLRLVMAGVVVGIGVSLVLARFLETQLAGMTAYDPTTLAATTALLMMTAAIACWIPARKAARVDPLIALRHQ
jgi:putative ABC transport system permease protein